MHLGIDLGTSGVKAVVTGEAGEVIAQVTTPLTVSRPRPLWSEQAPAEWWRATQIAIAQLREDLSLEGVRGIGLSGQMHGAVLLDAADRVLRPAILWNDGRSFAECTPLDPIARRIAGNLAMPGFTAPKLAWVRAHEPDIFAATARVLLPKDWLRLMMTGEALSEMSDAAGTIWLDVGARAWSSELLAATGLTARQMPALAEGTEPAGSLRSEIAEAWGLPSGCVVAGGAGDNAAGAAGIGCIAPGQAFVSLGTSGVIFVSDADFLPDPDRTVHAFCHCLPNTWHRMSVILSAAASLAWLARAVGSEETALLAELEQEGIRSHGRLVFLPYLSGERTPHNDATAAGVFFGLSASTTRADLTRAVLEGVAFALADGLEALEVRGGRIERLTAIGGGARSEAWLHILAAAFHRTLIAVRGGEVGPALGAARLGRIAAGDGTIAETCVPPDIAAEYQPESELAASLATRRALYRRLYPALRESFAAAAGS
jgi:xylulokinase